MVKMKQQLLTALCGIFTFIACKPEPRPNWVHFAFVIPVDIAPSTESVLLGDTLWLTANFSDSLLDLRSQKRYRLRKEEVELTSYIYFQRLLGAGQAPTGFAQGFKVVNQIGKLGEPTTSFRSFEPSYDGNHYRARMGIIPQSKGAFSLSFLTNLKKPLGPKEPFPVLSVPPDANGDPQRAMLDGMYYIINQGKTNFALLQQNSLVVSTNPDPAEATLYYEQKSTFAFIVK